MITQKLAVKKEFYLYKKREMKVCDSIWEELYRVIPSDQESFLANTRKPTEKFGGAGENLCSFSFFFFHCSVNFFPNISDVNSLHSFDSDTRDSFFLVKNVLRIEIEV